VNFYSDKYGVILTEQTNNDRG